MPESSQTNDPSGNVFETIVRDVTLPALTMSRAMEYLRTANRELAIRRNRVIGCDRRHVAVDQEDLDRIRGLEELQQFLAGIRACYPPASAIIFHQSPIK